MADKIQRLRPVMLLIVDGCRWCEQKDRSACRLAYTAPAIVAVMGLPKADDMTGKGFFAR